MTDVLGRLLIISRKWLPHDFLDLLSCLGVGTWEDISFGVATIYQKMKPLVDLDSSESGTWAELSFPVATCLSSGY